MSEDDHVAKSDDSDLYRLTITISESRLYIRGYQQDKVLLDSFCSSLHSTLQGMDDEENISIQRAPDTFSHGGQKIDYVSSRNREGFLECFEKRVKTTPKAIAVVFGDRKIDYATLNRSANRFARHLQSLGATRETLVGVGLDRSIELIISLLGILKAGSAYLPLDPTHPRERLQFILEDSGAEILVTHSSHETCFKNFQGKKIFLDKDFEEINKKNSTSLKVEHKNPEQLAYVLYTSGSTGKPKGVEITKAALDAFLAAMQHRLNLSDLDRWLALTTISFDISILEMLLPLRQGSTIVLGSRDIAMDLGLLAQTLKGENITFVQATPATWQTLIDAKWSGNSELTILCGGEILSQKLAHQLAQRARTLWNMYGPTETTIWSSMKKIKTSTEKITIGKPIANTQFYILDQEQNLLPVGVPGELHIGGLGLARGYRNRPALTEEKFISSSYGRLYKTGDLARYLPNGEIDFLGRMDTQVKIRGYRVELGEIEALLNRCPNVEQAVVIAREEKPGDLRIIAYYRGDAKQEELKERLISLLPSYMIPSAYIQVAEFQLNTNGKIDRKALPTPNYEFGKSGYVAPSNPIEIEVVKAFEKILEVPDVGVEDNFFALGGHSLLVARVVTKLNKQFQIQLPIKTLFESPTASLLAKEIQNALLLTRKIDRISNAEEGDSSGISSSQQGIWFLSHQTPKSALYNIPFTLELAGDLDLSSLQQALHTIVNRHEIFRTIFIEGPDHVESVVLDSNETPLHYEDLRGVSDSEVRADRMIASEARKPFDLSKGFLFRFLLLRLSKLKHRLFFNFHHMIFDGHSAYLFIHELKTLYEACKDGKPNPLENLSIQYSDYVSWTAKQPLNKENLSWWCENLQDAPPVLNLAVDRPRPPIQTYRGAVVEFSIANVAGIQALKKFAQTHESTTFTVFFAAFHAFLARNTNQNDFVIGVPVSGRTLSDTDPLIGCFAHTLPIRTRSSGDITFSELLRSIRNDWLKAFEHQDVPFERIVQELKVERSLSYSPVFQTMFNMLSQMDVEKIERLKVHLCQIDREMAHFDLSLSIQETPEGLRGFFEYNTDLFVRETIERMAKHFQNMTKSILANPDVSIGKIEVLDESEINKITVEWNKQPIAYSTNDTILQLIEKSAERQPKDVAVICGEESYTYSQLNSEANQIAHILLSKGLKKEDKIAVCLERSAAFIPAILGILKAGGSYVPLDPLEPQERMNAKIDELSPLCILTQEALKNRFTQRHTVCVDALPPASIQNPLIPISDDQLAYMIYTSGTTGVPKGVEIEHKSINDRVLWKQAAYPLSSNDVMLHTYSFIFDGSIINYFWPLCAGARLVIATKTEQFDSAGLIELIRKYGVTMVDLLPSLLRGLVDEKEFTHCTSLRDVFSGGEALPTDLIRSFFSKSSARLHNTYGPTEATVEASVWECEPGYRGTIAPIGKPIAGAKLYILDSNGSLVPEGVSGELYIGGLGLARGYFNDPIATGERFVSNLLGGERLYRTGDFVKYLSDGTIEFLGRVDSHQVKVRGYRIDLREIESALVQMDPIEKAIVLVKGEDDRKRLVAYLKISPPMDEAVLFELIRHSLSKCLPPYMIPQQICIVEQFPVLLNGKIDIKNLPEPAALGKKEAKKKCKNKLERQLLSVWKEVLDFPEIHVDDNFFEIGGNSLLAMRLMVKIRNQIGPSIPLIQFFQNPTIEGLAQSIQDKKDKKLWSPLVPMRTKGHKKPFFCVHPVGGSVMCYNSLARHWAEDRPFYALQARGLEEDQLPHDSIEEMAAEYISAMRQVQKTGPYFLGGWSFGGFIAAEMAKQLQQMGERVSRLILIDTTANIEKFKKIDAEDEGLLLSELTQHFKAEPSLASSLSFKEQFARFIDNGGKRAIRATKGSQTVDRLVSLAKANYRAMRKFSIPLLDVDVCLLKTEANPEKDLGWGRYAKNVTIFPVPGDHWSITQSQNARDYAQILQQCLDVQHKELGRTNALVSRKVLK
ncbi:MAG TPA: amino acid adenylation domain-containing protein [Chlamydiales bacterium]|nr:amino acid adenylation domain-containing protein [Chlamydiales bacterium]